MKPTFLLIHTEGVNSEKDRVCHIVAVPVENGEMLPPQEFFFNPEAKFEWVQSGITSKLVESFPPIHKTWPEVEHLLDRYAMKVFTGEGYSAQALYGTLKRLDEPFNPMTFCNAKAICRRTMNEVSYGLDYLCHANGMPFIETMEGDGPVRVAESWSELVLKGLETVAADTWEEFLSENRITPGHMSVEGFEQSRCKRDYSGRKKKEFDPTSVVVEADPEHPLFGMSVVFTGKLESMTREQARTAVVSVGGQAPDKLTMSIDYLVVGAQDLRIVGEKGLSGKMKTAAKYKEKGAEIEIIDENDFIQMMEK